jgi:hypothetical protein
MELKEGNIFRFKVEKKITLPDGEYFILLAEFNNKYLLPAKYYSEYNIQIGQEITCSIDRINCNGKVFLEPQNPIYSIGDRDIFIYQGSEERIKHKTKEKYQVVNVIGVKTKRAIIVENLISGSYSHRDNVFCEVVKIKKGELHLKVISKALN